MDRDEQSEDSLFQKCLPLSPDERRAFIEEVCRDKPRLRDRLFQLLESHENAPDFMESLPEEESETVARRLYTIAPAEEQPGDLIDRFRLLELIGEGSWGSVWEAQQTKPIQRMVTLKILKLGLDTREFLARFEAERQALALMDHNHIARVLDAGSTDYGRPYMVMELIVGMPLMQYVETKQLGIRERVSLFLDICQAIHHAHQRKIIHRDLKPSNILVAGQDGKPVPKVIDFGVAKTNRFRLTDKTLKTQLNAFMGTPMYCSPEQLGFTGAPLDARSDIYSLGVVLYELLCGETHFDRARAKDSSVEQLRTQMLGRDPPRLSTRFRNLSPAKKKKIAESRNSSIEALESSLTGELDWVVGKCLEKDPPRRYPSAQALADDLQAFLDHRPVTAAAPSRTYRVRKFISRKRPAYAVWLEASLAVVLLFAIIVLFRPWSSPSPLSLDQTPETPAVPNHLNRIEKSIAILPFVNSSNREEDQYWADGIHLDLLTQISQIDDIKTIAPQSVKGYRNTSKGSKTIGEELGVTTLLTGEVEQIGEHFLISVFLVEAESGVNLWAESYKQQLDSAADIFSIRNQIASAIADRLESVLTPEELKSIERVPTQNLRAWEAYYKGREILATDLRPRMQEAGEYFQQAIDLDPEFAQAYTALADALLRRTGITGDRLDPHITSTEVAQQANSLVTKALELDDRLADGHTLWGRFQRERGDYAGAEQSFERALEINPNYAYAWNQYALLQSDKEDMFAMVRKSIELDPGNARFKSDRILQLCWFARFEEAIAAGEEMIRTHPEYPRAYWLTAAVWMDAFGRYDKGVELLRRAAAIDPRDVWVNNYLVMAYEFMGDSAEAARWQELKMALRKDPPDFLQQFDLHRLRGEEAKALEACREYLRQGGDAFRAWRYVLNSDLRAGRYQEARARYEKAAPYLFEEDPKIEIHGGRDFDSRFEQPRMAMQLAAVLFATGAVEQASKLLERGWELFQQRSLMGSDGRFGYGIRDVVQHTLKGQKQEALDALREAVDAGYRDLWFLDCAELDPLREDPVFIALEKEIMGELARQLEAVREMDRRSELPGFPETSEWDTGNSDSTVASKAKPAGPTEKSIAILPFENLSPNPEHAYFTKAIHEEILTSLSQINDLFVIGRTTVLQYRKTRKTLKQIGEALKVRHLIEGSVFRDEDTVRIALKMVDAQSERVTWAKDFTYGMDQVFLIRSVVSKEVAEQLQAVLMPEEVANGNQFPTRNREAYDYYLRSSFTEDRKERNAFLKMATDLDPDFLLAWDRLVHTNLVDWRFRFNRGDPHYLNVAIQAMKEVDRLAPNAGRTLSHKANFAFHVEDALEKALKYDQLAKSKGFFETRAGLRNLQMGRLKQAQLEYEEILPLNPLNRDLNRYLFWTYCCLGEWDKAVTLINRFIEKTEDEWTKNRFSEYLALLSYLRTGDCEAYLAGRTRIAGMMESPRDHLWEALVSRDLLRAVELTKDQTFYWFQLIGGNSPYFQKGMGFKPPELLAALLWFELGEKEKSMAEVKKAKEFFKEIQNDGADSVPPDAMSLLSICYALEGERNKVEDLIPRIRKVTGSVNWQFREQAYTELHIAIAYLVLGDQEKAIEILEAACEMESIQFINRDLKIWFIFDRLKGNPRFDGLLE